MDYRSFSQCKYRVNFINSEENLRETKIKRMYLLKESNLKFYIVMPLTAILSMGMSLLLTLYSTEIKNKLLYLDTASIKEATHLLIICARGHKEIIKLERTDISPEHEIKFSFRFTKYIYSCSKEAFLPVVFDYQRTLEQIHSDFSTGIKIGEEHSKLIEKYGKCNIRLQQKSSFCIFTEQIINLFYIIQLYSIIIFLLDEYEVYAICMVIISTFSIYNEISDIKANMQHLEKILDQTDSVTVRRLNQEGGIVLLTLDCDQLVPGDVIMVSDNLSLPCDAILLSGS